MHQLEQDLCLELLIYLHLWNKNSNRHSMVIRELAERRQRSEGEHGNVAMVVWDIIDSDNEIYLMSLNK
jgi:hypothetical protein